jgi:small subunit ribosomal protein S6
LYELTYIINPLLGELDLNAAAEKVRSFVNGLGGQIKKEMVGEKRKLSYPIKKQTHGFYVTAEFEIEPEKLSELEKFLKTNGDILRHLVINLAERKIEKPAKRPFRPKPAVIPSVAAPLKAEKVEKVKIEELDKKLEELLKE